MHSEGRRGIAEHRVLHRHQLRRQEPAGLCDQCRSGCVPILREAFEGLEIPLGGEQVFEQAGNDRHQSLLPEMTSSEVGLNACHLGDLVDQGLIDPETLECSRVKDRLVHRPLEDHDGNRRAQRVEIRAG